MGQQAGLPHTCCISGPACEEPHGLTILDDPLHLSEHAVVFKKEDFTPRRVTCDGACGVSTASRGRLGGASGSQGQVSLEPRGAMVGVVPLELEASAYVPTQFEDCSSLDSARAHTRYTVEKCSMLESANCRGMVRKEQAECGWRVSLLLRDKRCRWVAARCQVDMLDSQVAFVPDDPTIAATVLHINANFAVANTQEVEEFFRVLSLDFGASAHQLRIVLLKTSAEERVCFSVESEAGKAQVLEVLGALMHHFDGQEVKESHL